ncbi:N-acetylglucosamine-6-phosphate deacetylase [bacterium]|nr:N-acetylglucosamine-6-phosphate deacetylase [bacterium]MBU1633567.1 N-acetylglucosamine-6-phosphate deacetylase [bacterium]MBU1874931.1 N-acetylglucosamine-6-phosphate deacetylase [bacterium]
MSLICLHNATVYTGITVLQKSTVMIADGKIEDVISNERFKKRQIPRDAQLFYLNGANIAAGFIDTHIHGLHGFDTADGNPDSILEMSKALLEYGVTGFCPTLYPQPDDNFLESIKAVVAAIGKEPGAKIYGMHLEGPFISPDKPGVLTGKYMRSVDINLMKKFLDVSQGHISIMTVAPELKNMHELAILAGKSGIVVSAGHSNATYENMLEGFQAGILHSTHFFNAMRRLHHRDPGVVGAIMIHANVSCEVIADGFHVHKAIMELLLRVKPVHKVVLVTDALKPTGLKSGTLIANDEEVVLDKGLFKLKSDGTIAGSALTMIKGVQNLYEMGIPLHDAIRMASINPANVINRQNVTGSLIPGKDADVVVFDNDFNVMMTFVKGELKKFSE